MLICITIYAYFTSIHKMILNQHKTLSYFQALMTKLQVVVAIKFVCVFVGIHTNECPADDNK